jgi:hypothetical protein
MRGIMMVVVAMCVMCLWGSDSQAQNKDDAIVKQVLEGWAKRRTAMKTVRYTIEGTLLQAKGSLTFPEDPEVPPLLRANFPPNDITFAKTQQFTFDFTKGHSRRVISDRVLIQATGKFVPRYVVWTCDGEKTTRHEPNDRNASEDNKPSAKQVELVIYKQSPRLMFTSDCIPILLAHGFPILYAGAFDERDLFKQRLSSIQFREHSRRQQDGRELYVLRSVPEVSTHGVYNEIVVDPSQDFAVRSWSRVVDGLVSSQSSITYQNDHGYWLPKEWQFDYYHKIEHKRLFERSERMHVKNIEIETSVPASQFQPEMKPGTIVSLMTSQSYVVAGDGSTLVAAGNVDQTRFSWLWFVLAGIMLLALVYGIRRWYVTR